MMQTDSLAEVANDLQGDALRIETEMSIYQAEALKALLLAAIRRNGTLALDLGAVTEIDSSGIQLLMLAWREAGRLGARIGIIACSDAVRRLLEAFGLHEMLRQCVETGESSAALALQTEETSRG
ncbi:STAS domain-containing protein [Dechloromonas agitata]|uniref:STAS domain-containing protein n=1 Tax=Dechloromonas agitata TaxID=73030 RepID=UPI000684E4CA|nr:STAS domain-containing protein [Dechloromonas agitata]